MILLNVLLMHFSNYRSPFTFDEFLDGTFRPRSFTGSWWSNTELLIKDREGNLITWDIITQKGMFLEDCKVQVVHKFFI